MDTAKSDALMGGGIGGVTAGAFPAAASIISSAWSNIKGRSVKDIANKLGISIPSAKVIRVALENDDLPAAQAALDRAGSSSMLADAGPSTAGLLDVSVTSGGKSPITKQKTSWVSLRTMSAKFLGMLCSIPSGLAIGPEGPIIHISALLGFWVTKLVHYLEGNPLNLSS